MFTGLITKPFGNITSDDPHRSAEPVSARPALLVPAQERRARPDARTRLLDAALEVVQERGVSALTQMHVAAAAGLRQSHLTYYFRTRSDLLKAVVQHAARTICGLVDGRPEEPVQSLPELRARLVKDVADIRMPRLMTAMTVASDEDPSLKAWMAQFEQTFLRLLADTLKRLGVRLSAEDVALFHATLIGISITNAGIATERSARQARALIGAALDRLLRS
ncbi:MAG: TetR/AcrR family transcriptional regulator, partial [Proteobacteria bacterium]|nr:TetR/AcrR family transcriptional regulator [Pseudomonadota bacterium]